MYTAYEVNNILDEPDILGIYFSLDVPSESLEDGFIVYQWATLSTSSSNSMTITCKVTVGDADSVQVK